MRISFRITRNCLSAIHTDLSRQHPFAYERVAFISCGIAEQACGDLLLIASGLHPVADSDYEEDLTVGAMLGPGAFRKVLQHAYSTPGAMFHVHRHEHHGHPAFSSIDLKESARFVPDFWKVQPRFPHGILLLSHDSIAGLAWLPEDRKPVAMSLITIVGNPIQEMDYGPR